MGRRRLWIIVGAALALAAVMFALVLLGAPLRYEFLEGRRPKDKEHFRLHGIDATGKRSTIKGNVDVYSWAGDSHAVLQEARSELLAKGFQQVRKEPGGQTYTLGASCLIDVGATSDLITVRVRTLDTPGLWDRFKSVFGL